MRFLSAAMRSSVRSLASSVNGRKPVATPAYLSRRTTTFCWRAAGTRGASVCWTTKKMLRATSRNGMKYLRCSSLLRTLSSDAVMRISRSCFTLGSLSAPRRLRSSAAAARVSRCDGSYWSRERSVISSSRPSTPRRPAPSGAYFAITLSSTAASWLLRVTHAGSAACRQRASAASAAPARIPVIGDSLRLCGLLDEPGLGRACGGFVRLLRHAPGEERFAAGIDRELHRVRHAHRVLRLGDRGVHEHAVAAELHRDRRVRGRADARVDLHRNL